MLKKINILSTFILIISGIHLFITTASAQDTGSMGLPFIFNYSHKINFTNTQIWCAVQDKKGILYFATNNGIVEYDANEWKRIKNSEDIIARWLDYDEETDRIYVGSAGDFAFLDNNQMNRVYNNSFLKRKKHIDLNQIWKVLVQKNNIFFISNNNQLVKLKNQKIENIKTHTNIRSLNAFKVDNEIIYFDETYGFGYISDDSLKFSNKLSQKLENITAILNFNDKNFLIATEKDGLFLIRKTINGNTDTTIREFASLCNDYLKIHKTSCAIKLSNNEFAIGTQSGGIVIVNRTGELIKKIDKNNGLLSNSIYYLYKDLQNNIWACTEQGISEIWLSAPFTRFNYMSGLDGPVSSIVDFYNNIIISTFEGLFYYSHKQNINSATNTIQTISKKNIFISTLFKYPISKDKEILLAGSLREVFYIDENLNVTTIKKMYSAKAICDSKFHDGYIFIGHPKGISAISVDKSTATPKFIDKGEIKNINFDVMSLISESNGGLWIGTAHQGLKYLKFTNNKDIEEFQTYNFDTTSGLPTIHENKPYIVNGQLIVSTKAGLYSLSNTSRQTNEPSYYYFVQDKSFGFNYSIDSITIHRIFTDNTNTVWFTTSNGIYKFINNTLTKVSPTYRYIMEFDNETEFFVDQNGNIWIGSGNNLYRFKTMVNITQKVTFPALIRWVGISSSKNNYNEVTLEGGFDFLEKNQYLKYPKSIPYNENSIQFKYTATSYGYESANLFNTFLEGFDKDWNGWSNRTERSFMNLNEGKYKFKIKAKNILEQESTVAIFEFEISAPWFRTWFAYFVYILIFIIMLFLAIKFNTNRLKKANEKLESIINERTYQIAEQKEEIQAQAEKLSHQAENLILTNNELKHLSLVAQETDNSVVILDNRGNFEWWNKGFSKLFNYRFEELKNADFKTKQKKLRPDLLNEIRNYNKEKATVKYTSHEVFQNGEEIWYQTTINPVYDENGAIFRFVAMDFDITQIKLAEREIENQNEEIQTQAEQLIITNKELEKLSVVARETDNSIMIFDSNGTIEWINEGFSRLFGYRIEELNQKSDNNLLINVLMPNIINAIAECRQTKRFVQYSSKTITKAGKTIWIQTTLSPILDINFEITKFIAIDSDISKIKQAEEEILSQRNEIERQRDQIFKTNEEMRGSILYAKRIQEAMLPPTMFIDAVLNEYFILNKPCEIVSGDFYWVSYSEEKTFVAVADCTGHGIPGAFMSMLGITSLKDILTHTKNIKANEILDVLREKIMSSMHQRGKEGEATDGMDIAMCIIDFQNKKMQYSGANNPIYIVPSQNPENNFDYEKQLFEIKPDKMPIGIHYNSEMPFTNHEIDLQSGNTLYLFTDGYSDQFGGKKNRKFLSRNFKKLLITIQNIPLKEQADVLNAKHEEWKGYNEQVDDILIFGIKIP